MDLRRLQTLSGFETLTPSALRAAAERTRLLKLPARRWLVRPGRSLSDTFYLLEGRVRVVQEGRGSVVVAPSARAREPVYPGVAGLETVAPSVFASIHPDVLAELGGDAFPALGVPQVCAAKGSWQQKFLDSPVMQRLPPSVWQRVLRAMSRHEFAAGALIVQSGTPADRCYVLSAGRAEVFSADGASRLARLQPGDLFGEDALVTGGSRNANVVMSSAGAAVSLTADCFESWLLDAVVRPLECAGTRLLVTVDPEPGGRLPALPLTNLRAAVRRLPPGRRYAIIGGSGRERSLASFLLAQRGIDARPLAG